MKLSRRQLIGAGIAAGAASPRWSLAEMLRSKGIPVKMGATDWNLRQEASLSALELGRRIGFQGVQVSLTDRRNQSEPPRLKSLAEAAAHREEARKQGVAISSTCLNILHINYLKNDKLGQKWVADSIPVTKTMGTKVILLPFFGNGRFTNRTEMAYVADFLKEIGPEAHKAGVILGLEDTVSAEDNMFMVDRAKSQAVKVYYDTGNSHVNGFDVVKEIRWLGRDNICEIHIKDNPNYLGKGKINFPAVVNAIADIGFKEWCVLETDSPSRDVESDMRTNLRYITDLFAKRAEEDEIKHQRRANPWDGV